VHAAFDRGYRADQDMRAAYAAHPSVGFAMPDGTDPGAGPGDDIDSVYGGAGAALAPLPEVAYADLGAASYGRF
jgi:hypothetical protein